MKFNLKMIAVAAAMVAASSAHADLIGANVAAGAGSTGSSLALVAFNTVTSSYYVRDLGLTLNSFLPTGVTTLAGDGGVSGDKTPEAGLTIDKTTNASFADVAFSSWLSGQADASAVRWTVTAGDSLRSTTNGFARLLLAATGPLQAVTNGIVASGSTGVTGLAQQNPGMGLSTTGATVLAAVTQNELTNQAATLTALGAAANLYYFVTTTFTGSTGTVTPTEFGNSAGFATLTLASNGDLSYVLAPASVSAVPVPAAAWLLGSGLLSLGGMVRRRKAAAQA